MLEHDDTPCDFLAYLEWRLGQDADATARLLVEWLAAYQPAENALRARSGRSPLSSDPHQGAWCEDAEAVHSTGDSDELAGDVRSRFGHEGTASGLAAGCDF
jgi:hypothetical protein